jgi:hypothetical protein
VVQGQPGQRVSETLFSTNRPGKLAHTCHPSYGRLSEVDLAKNERPYLKNNKIFLNG